MSWCHKLGHKEKYELHQVKLYAEGGKDDAIKQAFFVPAITNYLKSKAPGRVILDIGCGLGDWSCLAVECGARSVKGFDIQEDMVKLAKQATARYGSSVNICAGDVMKMPYDDNMFDIAMSLYVLPVLRQEAYVRHFQELHRVLIPGGKAIVVNLTKSAFDKMFLTSGADQTAVIHKIENKLLNLSDVSTEKEMNDAFKDLHEVLLVTFAINKDGNLYRVTDTDQLTNGQAVWIKNQAMIFPDYYYEENFLLDQIRISGLHIDYVENYCTEEQRLFYNSTNSIAIFDKTFVDCSPFQFYHLSKS